MFVLLLTVRLFFFLIRHGCLRVILQKLK
jgi:hypothetical protein